MPLCESWTCRTSLLVAAGCLFLGAGTVLAQSLDTSSVSSKRRWEVTPRIAAVLPMTDGGSVPRGGGPRVQNTILIIGNDDYTAPGYADLPSVVNDVTLMDDKFSDNGWTTVVAHNLTADQMETAIMMNLPPDGKKYIVYYSGHGDNTSTGELVGVDGSVLTPAEFVNALGDQYDCTIGIFDSCGSGAFADAVNALQPGIATIAATTGLECAEKGVFTPPFVMGLCGAADVNGDGTVTLGEAGAYAESDCGGPTQTPQYDEDLPSTVLTSVDDSDDCADAHPIGEGVFVFDTTGATNDGAAPCGVSAASPDVWFAYTPSGPGNASVETCGLAAYDSVLSVHTICGGAALTCNDDSCGVQSRIGFPVSTGSTYLVRVTGYNGATGAGSIRVALGPPCLFEHLGFATPEPEACGDESNGGCNQPVGDPPAYTDISCDTTIAGLSWAAAGTRDTDWYRINPMPGVPVTVAIQSAFPSVLFAFSEGCPAAIAFFTDADCSRDGILEFIATGPTVLFVSTGSLSGAIFDGIPCGTASSNGYNLSVLFGQRCGPACPCDWNHSGDLNSQDFFDFLVGFFNGNADFNNDNLTNSQDFFDFLTCFFNGCSASTPPYQINLNHTGVINNTPFTAIATGSADPSTGVILVRWQLSNAVPGYDPLNSLVTLGGTGGGGTVATARAGASNLLQLTQGNWDFVATVPGATTTFGSVRTMESVINVNYQTQGAFEGGPVQRLYKGGFDQTQSGPGMIHERQRVIMQAADGSVRSAVKQVDIFMQNTTAVIQPQIRTLFTEVLYRSPDSLTLIVRYESEVELVSDAADRCRYEYWQVVRGRNCAACPEIAQYECTVPCRTRGECPPPWPDEDRACAGGGVCTVSARRAGCTTDGCP